MANGANITVLELDPIEKMASLTFESGLELLTGKRASIIGITPFGLDALIPMAIDIDLRNRPILATARIGTIDFHVGGVVTEQDSHPDRTRVFFAFHSDSNVERITDERLSTRWRTREVLPPFGCFANPLKYSDTAYFVVRDVSLSGLRFHTSLRNKFLVRGQRFVCTVTFPSVGELTTTLAIRAVDLLESDSGQMTLSVGAEFVDLSDRHIDLISKYLTRYSDAPLLRLADEGLLADSLKGVIQFIEISLKTSAEKGANDAPSHEIVGHMLGESVIRARVQTYSGQLPWGGDQSGLLATDVKVQPQMMSTDVIRDVVAYLALCALNRSLSLLVIDANELGQELSALGFWPRRLPEEGQMTLWEINVAQASAGYGVGLLAWGGLWRHLYRKPADSTTSGTRLTQRASYRLLLPLSSVVAGLQNTLRPTSVAWDHYALHYDKMCGINPAYQANIQLINRWLHNIGASQVGMVYELGAGTGNLTRLLARSFPTARVVHVDQDRAMNFVARRKYRLDGAENVRIVTKRIEELDVEDGSVDILLCSHTLYSLSTPTETLERIFGWIKPGGYFLVIDIGRPIRVVNWAAYLFWHSLRQSGLISTLRLFIGARQVARQNRNIAAKQLAGEYWSHSSSSFEDVLETVGFDVLEMGQCYRGISDYAVCRKPAADRCVKVSGCE
jgi:ubiquinone/menaquinone biosynthesis C-methylase UbiE